MAFSAPWLWAPYKETRHFIQERTQEKQTSKQVNKQRGGGGRKREVRMKTAKNTPTQHCPEKPTPSQNLPTLSSPLPHPCFTHTHTHSSSHHRSHHLSLSPYKHVHTCQHASKSRNQPHDCSHTNLCCGHSSHGAAGTGPGAAMLAPFTAPSPASPPPPPPPHHQSPPPASPGAHTPLCQNYPT